MSPAAIGVVIVFLAVGLVLGWYSQKTSAAHSDVKVAKNRLSGGRRTRWRSAVVVLLLGLVTLLAVKDVLLPR
jgi:H+/Cl- antiporter ClcA